MNKKKALTLFAAVALIGAMGVGATLAYFTDTEETTNVVTMGNVNIKLTETSNEESYEITEDGLSFEDVLPGQTVSKIPTISLDGTSQDAYIRVKVEVEMDGTDAQKKALTDELQSEILFDVVSVDENGKKTYARNNWFLGADDYYYYNTALTDYDTEVVVFDQVIVPASWDNSMAGEEFSIEITAEAIQKDYLDGVLDTETVGTIEYITGWDLDTDDDEVNDIAIEKYTKQTTGTTEESVQ